MNNAGSGLPSDETLETQIAFLQRESEVGATTAAAQAQEEIRSFYESAATLVGTSDPSTIAFMDSASRAWNMALYGSGVGVSDRIVTLSSEFGTNLVSLHHFAERVGAKVEMVPAQIDGSFDLEYFQERIDGAALVAISHVAAHGSIVNPVAEIGQVCRALGVTFLVDGCQALGQFPVDLEAIGCDAYTATGRKWLAGPRGTGFLFVRAGTKFRTPYVDLANAALVSDTFGSLGVRVNETAKQFELWERSVAGLLALGAAIRQSQSMLADKASLEPWHDEAQRLRRAVTENSRLTLIGKTQSESHITGFFAAPDVIESAISRFSDAQVAISVMGNYDAPAHLPNDVKRIIRLAPHHYTPAAVVEAALSVVEDL